MIILDKYEIEILLVGLHGIKIPNAMDPPGWQNDVNQLILKLKDHYFKIVMDEGPEKYKDPQPPSGEGEYDGY